MKWHKAPEKVDFINLKHFFNNLLDRACACVPRGLVILENWFKGFLWDGCPSEFFLFYCFHLFWSVYHNFWSNLFQNFRSAALQLPLNTDFWIFFWNTASSEILVSLPTSLGEFNFLEFFGTLGFQKCVAFVLFHYMDSGIEFDAKFLIALSSRTSSCWMVCNPVLLFCYFRAEFWILPYVCYWK